MKRITPKKIREFIKEEKQASKMYRSYGFKGPSRDEARHSRYFTRMLKGGKR